MPVLDGIEATKVIRKLGYRMPIIGLTANDDAESRRDASDAGMDDFVTKPMRFLDLRNAIERALRPDLPRKSGNSTELL